MEIFYRQEIKHNEALKEVLKKRLLQSSIGRLIAFAFILFFIYKWAETGETLFIPAAIIAIVLFFYLIRLSADLTTRKKFTENLIKLYDNEINLMHSKSGFFDEGAAFDNLVHYNADLDVFGKYSLFHLLNRTTTFNGRAYLANALASPKINKEEILEWQNAVKVASKQTIACNELTATGLLNEEPESMNEFDTWLQLPVKVLNKKIILPLLWVFPVASVSSLLIYLSSGNYIYLLLIVITAWGILSVFLKYINHQHLLLTKKVDELKQYAGILSKFTALEEEGSLLIKKLKTEAAAAEKAVAGLSKLASMADHRNNLLVNLFLNSLFLYDLIIVRRLEKWKAAHKERFSSWQMLLNEIEYLVSLAAFARNNPSYQYPQIEEGAIHLNATSLGHPLISDKEMVYNTVQMNKEKVWIITGSNMAGKTTFLRTIGINVILAQNGAPVCADSMSLTPMYILSSVRVQDSLHEQTSYFMAELKRLLFIIQELKKGRPSLVMVDEILRGTNSDDKTYGSAQFIKQLLKYDCLGLIATHDLALCSLEDEYPGLIANYSFESLIENGTLSFDYVLRKGIATNKNASFLMEKMGIISS